ncbi:MAG: glycoside hydrolase family 2 [Bacteroidales bacterium]|nr:glycoside hydrolase family 2 [Bacteroidales bacterium]
MGRKSICNQIDRMNFRSFFAFLASVAFCISAGGQTPHKQMLSTNFGLPSPQPEETLPKSPVPVQMPERVAKVAAQTVLRPMADNVWEITSGWEMCEGDKVMTEDWYNATVPGTVLRTLVDQGVYPDPYYGLNNLAIPEELCRKDWWYRCSFCLSDLMLSKETLELLFSGINYKADIWFNGEKLGNIAGAFIRGRFDISSLAKHENTLAVHIYPPANPGIPHEQSPAAGGGKNGGALCLDGPTFFCSEGWDWIPGVRDRNIGIWQDVRLVATGGVSLGDIQVITDLPLPDVSYADLTVRTTLKNSTSSEKSVTLEGKIGEIMFSEEVSVPPGTEVPVSISAAEVPQLRMNNPELWMPNGYGEPNLYELELRCFDGSEVSDIRKTRFGVRELSYELTVDAPSAKGIRIEHNPISDNRLGEILDHRMLRDTLGGIHIPSLAEGIDLKDLNVIPEDGMSPYLVIKVNGTRIFCRGGNWGMDDMMKNVSREHLEPYLILHKEANFNMIRNWTGVSTSETLYELCDEYGIMVWNDFWLSTEGFNLNPLDEDLFMSNAEDVVRRFRHHPSIVMWCPRNEGYATETLERRLSAMIQKEDITRRYHPNSRQCNLRHSGPWHYYKDAGVYYSYDAHGFNSELGSPSVPTAASMRKMMPEADLWPISDTWHYHDLLDGLHEYVGAVDRLYGKAENLDDFCRKVQFINYDSYRAMFESWNSRMWGDASGVLLWMSHPAWPSVEWQTYSWDYETFGSYYGSRKACEPVHVQMNLDDHDVVVLNTTASVLEGLEVALVCYDLAGKKLMSRVIKDVDVSANARKDLFRAEFGSITGNYMVRLVLSDRRGQVLSINDYMMRGEGTEDFTALGNIGKAKIKVRKISSKGSVERYEVTNTSGNIAMNLKFNLCDPQTGEIILPAYFSDGYFHLLPGEKRTIQMHSPSTGAIMAEGYNVDNIILKL